MSEIFGQRKYSSFNLSNFRKTRIKRAPWRAFYICCTSWELFDRHSCSAISVAFLRAQLGSKVYQLARFGKHKTVPFRLENAYIQEKLLTHIPYHSKMWVYENIALRLITATWALELFYMITISFRKQRLQSFNCIKSCRIRIGSHWPLIAIKHNVNLISVILDSADITNSFKIFENFYQCSSLSN